MENINPKGEQMTAKLSKLYAENVTVRFLGDNLTLTRGQWVELADMLDRSTDADADSAEVQALRIREAILPSNS